MPPSACAARWLTVPAPPLPACRGRARLSLPLLSARLASAGERLNAGGARLERGLEACARQSSARLDKVAGRSLPLLAARLDQGRQRLAAQRLVPGLLSARLAEGRRHLAATQRVMVSLNPDNVLKRGYARITGPDGTTLTTRAAAAGAPLRCISTMARWMRPPGAPPVPPRAAPASRARRIAAPAPRQDDLFG
jgi:exodeoxyribonuclease VII large subunit